MAVYYVSTQRGDDLNNGATPETPFSTIGKAVNVVAAGDTVYIGPGTYRERVTLLMSGDEGSVITWQGDPHAVYVTGDTPGRVRVTGCGVDEIPTLGTVWFTNNKGYNRHYDIHFDGCKTTNVGTVLGTGTDVSFYYCYAEGTGYGFQNCAYCEGCVGVASYAFMACTLALHCIGHGAFRAFNNTSTVHCLGLNGGFDNSTSVTHTNSMAWGAYAGFRGRGSLTTLTNCLSVNCDVVAWGNSVDDDLEISNMYYANCRNLYNDVNAVIGVPTEVATVLMPLETLGFALQPILASGLRDIGTAVGAPVTDILGRARDATPDIGLWEVPVVSLSASAGDWRFAPPGILVSRAGQHVLKLGVRAGQVYRVFAQVNHANAVTRPQLIARGPGVTTQTATMTGDTWEELSVQFTAACDAEVDVVLYARDTGANAVAYFSDLRVTGEKHGTLWENLPALEQRREGRVLA